MARRPDKASHARVSLTICATTDLHMRLTAGPAGRGSLARIATRVAALRASDPALVLLDNGDALQGDEVARLAAASRDGATTSHPMIAAMNAMGYDAMAPGNHDFDFGLDALRAALAQAHFAVLSANLKAPGSNWPIRPRTMLTRNVIDSAGKPGTVKIGVIGVQPPEIPAWSAEVSGAQLTSQDMITAATREIAAARAEGADVVVVLAHTGMEAGDGMTGSPENHGLSLSRLDGADLLVLGHTHAAYPMGEGCPEGIGPVPVMQPGHHGAWLAHARLTLERADAGWQVSGAEVTLDAVETEPENAAISAIAAPWIARADRMLAQEVGQTTTRLHGHFGGLPDDPATCWIAQVLRAHATEALHPAEVAGLPVLGSATPVRGFSPGDPPDVAAGTVTAGDIRALAPHEDRIVALRMTAAVLRRWLQHASFALNEVTPGAMVPLRNPQVPLYRFDHLAGLEYSVDLGRGWRDPGRIGELSVNAAVPGDGDEVIVALNSHRAATLSMLGVLQGATRLDLPALPVRDVLQSALARGPAQVSPPGWTLAPVPDARVWLDLAPRDDLPPPPSGAHYETDGQGTRLVQSLAP